MEAAAGYKTGGSRKSATDPPCFFPCRINIHSFLGTLQCLQRLKRLTVGMTVTLITNSSSSSSKISNNNSYSILSTRFYSIHFSISQNDLKTHMFLPRR